MIGPVLRLKLLGGICPCIMSEEDQTARQAIQFLSGRFVVWKKPNATANDFSLGRLFSSGRSTNSSPSEVKAIFRISDSEDEKPEIVVIPTAQCSEGDPEEDSGGPHSQPPKAEMLEPVRIKLKRFDKVSIDKGDEIVLKAPKVTQGPGSRDKSPPKELLRLTLLDAKVEERNLFVHHMAVLVEWEKQRRVKANEEYDDDDDEDQPNFLKAQAAKAAHFAQRELELQTTRRDRAKRKEQLMAKSGGMKYTALAMAGSK